MTKDEGLNPRRSPSGVGAGGAGGANPPQKFSICHKFGQ